MHILKTCTICRFHWIMEIYSRGEGGNVIGLDMRQIEVHVGNVREYLKVKIGLETNVNLSE